MAKGCGNLRVLPKQSFEYHHYKQHVLKGNQSNFTVYTLLDQGIF